MMQGMLLDEKDILPAKSEEDISQFLREIRMYPLITPQQEQELAVRSARGDRAAIRMLVNSNLRLVVSIAKKYMKRGLSLQDLIQEGCIGLLAAAENFDHTKNCRFSTYATMWIRQSIDRSILNFSGTIRIPRNIMEKVRKIFAARAALMSEDGQQPQCSQIAQRAGIPEDKVAELLALYPQIGSLDAPVGEDGEGVFGALISDVEAPQPYEELVCKELEHTMDTLLGMLTPRQQQILRLRFGFDDGIGCSLQKISEVLGISKERVRQIEQQAIEKLQKLGADFGLEEFLE